MSKDTHIVNIEAIGSFSSLIKELATLEHELPKHNLGQFLVFNQAYRIITSAIMEASQNHYFNNPKFVEEFTVCFARYYFAAINETVSNSAKLPSAWRAFNAASHYQRMPNAILLLMGANAHINHDLPRTLAESIASEKSDNLLVDVLRIDRLLMKSGKNVISIFDEKNWLLDLLKRRVIFLYYRPIMYMILYWRLRAWRDYKSIKRVGLRNSTYAERSVDNARRLMWLGLILV